MAATTKAPRETWAFWGWAIFATFWFIVGMVLLNIASDYFSRAFWRPFQGTFQERIVTLSNSLRDATSIVNEIQTELDKRLKLVAELEQKARTAKDLSSANKAQVEAIALLLRDQLDANERWDFWFGIAQNFFFMIAGTVFGYLFERRMSRRQKLPLSASGDFNSSPT